MTDARNQRQAFRIEGSFEAELFHEGRVAACRVLNLSAGGAAVETALEMPAGTQCTLGLRLEAELRGQSPVPYVSFLMEVLGSQAVAGGDLTYRLRNATAEGTQQYEAATKLVFAAQRARAARETGTADSSPMAMDEPRRRRIRVPLRSRFSRGSMRPGSGD